MYLRSTYHSRKGNATASMETREAHNIERTLVEFGQVVVVRLVVSSV